MYELCFESNTSAAGTLHLQGSTPAKLFPTGCSQSQIYELSHVTSISKVGIKHVNTDKSMKAHRVCSAAVDSGMELGVWWVYGTLALLSSVSCCGCAALREKEHGNLLQHGRPVIANTRKQSQGRARAGRVPWGLSCEYSIGTCLTRIRVS